jgi:hypothetical protein
VQYWGVKKSLSNSDVDKGGAESNRREKENCHPHTPMHLFKYTSLLKMFSDVFRVLKWSSGGSRERSSGGSVVATSDCQTTVLVQIQQSPQTTEEC